MLRCILKNIPKYFIKKYVQIVLLISKLHLSYFYVTFKQWLQELKSPYMYTSFIRLIPIFYDMYIIILYIYIYIYYNPKFKKLSSGYDYS